MKKEGRSLKSIERREKRIEKKTQWIFWIVVAILVILALFYLKSYYTESNILTGKGTGGDPAPEEDNGPSPVPGGGGSGEGSFSEQAKKSTEKATVSAGRTTAFANAISEASTFSETEESLIEIKKIKNEVTEELEKTKAFLDKDGLSRSTVANIRIRIEQLENFVVEMVGKNYVHI